MNRLHVSNTEFIHQLTLKIEENLHNEQFGVTELAAKIGMSRSTLYSKVSAITGHSVCCLIREVRLKQAKRLLAETSLSVAEIAWEVGFGSPTYFIKCFHDYYGFPPGEYTRQAPENEPAPVVTELTRVKPPAFHPFGKRILVPTALVILLLIPLAYVLTTDRKHRGTDLSIAALPVRNLTSTQTNNYLCETLHEAITSELAKFNSMRVISSTSTLKFGNSTQPLREIAGELHVNYIIESSVSETGSHTTLHIQLIRVFPNENHVLVKTYTCKGGDSSSMLPATAKDFARAVNAALVPPPASPAPQS